MLTFEQAGAVLDAAAETLPQGIFDDLNGGVNLLPEEKLGEDGRYVMGLYHHDAMGRWVEIFYGSFCRVYGDADDATVAEELRKTLFHELTHHVESKAGDHSLEDWDAEQTALWREGEPLRAGSVLFVDGDGRLSLEADALFRAACAERRLSVPSAWCALEGVTSALLADFEAVLCMTLEQADSLAERFPEADEKILCLGEEDILPDRRATPRQLRREIALLAEELAETAKEA